MDLDVRERLACYDRGMNNSDMREGRGRTVKLLDGIGRVKTLFDVAREAWPLLLGFSWAGLSVGAVMVYNIGVALMVAGALGTVLGLGVPPIREHVQHKRWLRNRETRRATARHIQAERERRFAVCGNTIGPEAMIEVARASSAVRFRLPYPEEEEEDREKGFVNWTKKRANDQARLELALELCNRFKDEHPASWKHVKAKNWFSVVPESGPTQHPEVTVAIKRDFDAFIAEKSARVLADKRAVIPALADK